MLIGISKSPHLEALVQGILANGDVLTDIGNTGCDVNVCWGWPTAQWVSTQLPKWANIPIICVDCHPFALRKGDTSGARILQLNNWGALAQYPDVREEVERKPPKSNPDGPVLVLGQVYTAEQKKHGFIDVWHTGGYEDWVKEELAKPNRKFRKHPRIWAVENSGEVQPSLTDDLKGCSRVVSWNSTAAVHAILEGYEASSVEQHGWARMDVNHLAALRAYPAALRSGEYWHSYREWLRSPLTTG